jgi:endonuclease I
MNSYLILLLLLLNFSQQKDAATLLAELRQSVAKGKPSSYNELWSTYLKAFVKSDGYIKDYYSSYSKYTSKDRDTGSGGAKEGERYNREHSIPKSWWGGSTATGSQGADPFIVIPADKFVNNKRSSYPLGKVARAKFTSIDGYSKLGDADTSYGYSGTVFEPNDDVKGDLARIVFYSIVKYENSFKWTSGGGSAIYSGDKNKNFGLTDYAVKLFTKWNEMDPPDAWEISMNNALNNIQGNKNPFIEHPEYVNMIWGNAAKSANFKKDKEMKKFLSFTKN